MILSPLFLSDRYKPLRRVCTLLCRTSCICAFFLLTGCARTPLPTVYMLPSAAEKTLTSDATVLSGPRVVIGPLTMPGYLDHTRLIVRENSNARLTLTELSIWAEPLNEGVTRVLCDAVSARIRPLGGTAFPLRAAIPPSWRITVDVARLDGAPNAQVVLDASYCISATEGEPVVMGRYTKQLPTDATLESMVNAQGALLDAFGAVLGEEIVRATSAPAHTVSP